MQDFRTTGEESDGSTGGRLRLLRRSLQISQEKMAPLLGVGSGVAVSKYERGAIGLGHIRAAHLADEVGTTTEWLLSGTHDTARTLAFCACFHMSKQGRSLHAMASLLGVEDGLLAAVLDCVLPPAERVLQRLASSSGVSLLRFMMVRAAIKEWFSSRGERESASEHILPSEEEWLAELEQMATRHVGGKLGTHWQPNTDGA